MQSMRRRIATVALATLLTAGTLVAGTSRMASADEMGSEYSAAEPHSGFDDQYIFAATKAVSNMDVNPAIKVTLIPVTVVLDTAFLPFAVIAGLVA
jgi:uncharacterized protein YceK